MKERWIWQWRCCGHLWELIPAWRYPNRNDFQPTCPTCLLPPSRRWVKLPRSAGSSVSQGR